MNEIDYSFLDVPGLTGDKLTKVTNMSRRFVSYILAELGGTRREFAPGASKNLTMHELFTLKNSIGGEQLIYDSLFIDDNDIKKALGLPTKEEVPEFSWTREKALKVLKEGSNDEILDALEFGPKYIAEWWKADVLNIKDIDRRNFIGHLFHMNVERAEENAKWAAEDTAIPNGYAELLGNGKEKGSRQRRTSPGGEDSLGNAPTVARRRNERIG